jgi:hypothetical protein
MAKIEGPTPDTPPPAAAAVLLTAEQLQQIVQGAVMAAVQATQQMNAGKEDLSAERIAEITAQASLDAHRRATPGGHAIPIADFHAISYLNPKGERDCPREELRGEVFWAGVLLHKLNLTHEEIALLNRLKPGEYHGKQWKVIDKSDGSTTPRLLIQFPCADFSMRASLPSMLDMLREMVGDTRPAAAA